MDTELDIVGIMHEEDEAAARNLGCMNKLGEHGSGSNDADDFDGDAETSSESSDDDRWAKYVHQQGPESNPHGHPGPRRTHAGRDVFRSNGRTGKKMESSGDENGDQEEEEEEEEKSEDIDSDNDDECQDEDDNDDDEGEEEDERQCGVDPMRATPIPPSGRVPATRVDVAPGPPWPARASASRLSTPSPLAIPERDSPGDAAAEDRRSAAPPATPSPGLQPHKTPSRSPCPDTPMGPSVLPEDSDTPWEASIDPCDTTGGIWARGDSRRWVGVWASVFDWLDPRGASALGSVSRALCRHVRILWSRRMVSPRVSALFGDGDRSIVGNVDRARDAYIADAWARSDRSSAAAAACERPVCIALRDHLPSPPHPATLLSEASDMHAAETTSINTTGLFSLTTAETATLALAAISSWRKAACAFGRRIVRRARSDRGINDDNLIDHRSVEKEADEEEEEDDEGENYDQDILTGMESVARQYKNDGYQDVVYRGATQHPDVERVCTWSSIYEAVWALMDSAYGMGCKAAREREQDGDSARASLVAHERGVFMACVAARAIGQLFDPRRSAVLSRGSVPVEECHFYSRNLSPGSDTTGRVAGPPAIIMHADVDDHRRRRVVAWRHSADYLRDVPSVAAPIANGELGAARAAPALLPPRVLWWPPRSHAPKPSWDLWERTQDRALWVPVRWFARAMDSEYAPDYRPPRPPAVLLDARRAMTPVAVYMHRPSDRATALQPTLVLATVVFMPPPRVCALAGAARAPELVKRIARTLKILCDALEKFMTYTRRPTASAVAAGMRSGGVSPLPGLRSVRAIVDWDLEASARGTDRVSGSIGAHVCRLDPVSCGGTEMRCGDCVASACRAGFAPAQWRQDPNPWWPFAMGAASAHDDETYSHYASMRPCDCDVCTPERAARPTLEPALFAFGDDDDHDEAAKHDHPARQHHDGTRSMTPSLAVALTQSEQELASRIDECLDDVWHEARMRISKGRDIKNEKTPGEGPFAGRVPAIARRPNHHNSPIATTVEPAFASRSPSATHVVPTEGRSGKRYAERADRRSDVVGVLESALWVSERKSMYAHTEADNSGVVAAGRGFRSTYPPLTDGDVEWLFGGVSPRLADAVKRHKTMVSVLRHMFLSPEERIVCAHALLSYVRRYVLDRALHRRTASHHAERYLEAGPRAPPTGMGSLDGASLISYQTIDWMQRWEDAIGHRGKGGDGVGHHADGRLDGCGDGGSDGDNHSQWARAAEDARAYGIGEAGQRAAALWLRAAETAEPAAGRADESAVLLWTASAAPTGGATGGSGDGTPAPAPGSDGASLVRAAACRTDAMEKERPLPWPLVSQVRTATPCSTPPTKRQGKRSEVPRSDPPPNRDKRKRGSGSRSGVVRPSADVMSQQLTPIVSAPRTLGDARHPATPSSEKAVGDRTSAPSLQQATTIATADAATTTSLSTDELLDRARAAKRPRLWSQVTPARSDDSGREGSGPDADDGTDGENDNDSTNKKAKRTASRRRSADIAKKPNQSSSSSSSSNVRSTKVHESHDAPAESTAKTVPATHEKKKRKRREAKEKGAPRKSKNGDEASDEANARSGDRRRKTVTAAAIDKKRKRQVADADNTAPSSSSSSSSSSSVTKEREERKRGKRAIRNPEKKQENIIKAYEEWKDKDPPRRSVASPSKLKEKRALLEDAGFDLAARENEDGSVRELLRPDDPKIGNRDNLRRYMFYLGFVSTSNATELAGRYRAIYDQHAAGRLQISNDKKPKERRADARDPAPDDRHDPGPGAVTVATNPSPRRSVPVDRGGSNPTRIAKRTPPSSQDKVTITECEEGDDDDGQDSIF